MTFNANGGSGAPASVTTVATKHGISSTDVPTRKGYSFQGWSTSKNATTVEYNAGQSIRLDKDITLYAVWKENVNNYREDAEKLVNQIREGIHPVCQLGDSRVEYVEWLKGYDYDVSWCSIYASWFLVGQLGVSDELKTASCQTHLDQMKNKGATMRKEPIHRRLEIFFSSLKTVSLQGMLELL